MKTLVNSLFVALTFSAITLFSSVSASAGIPKQPHQSAAYQVGVYGSQDGTKLNVAVDKQSGGRVNIVLKDARGAILYYQSLRSNESKFRTRLDVSTLTAGSYNLEVSNGRETTVRTLTIRMEEPAVAVATRTIALL